ncbi:hypothetical protein IW140_006512 [Coemansia sp. RSA 1813]|nr:hypothetical protein IW140_006512 [Coemansia sp. RSA 1813]
MGIFGFKVMDLCRMLNMPLAKACKSFKCEQQKLSLDHSQVQSMFMSGRLQGYMQDNYSKIREYNMMDVKTLSELYFKTRHELDRLCSVNIEDHMTLAGMSYRIFKDLNKKIEFPLHGDSEKKLVRKTVVGGRAQMFQVGEYDSEALCCIDCVSLYPYVMLNNMFPVGEAQVCEKYKEDRIGVYRIEVLSQPNIKIIPERERDERLNWGAERIECCVTSQDIDTLQRHNCRFKVIFGIYWENDMVKLFQSYFDPLVREKIKQDSFKDQDNQEYNPAVRELCKLLMNSLSGKLIQKDYNDVIEIVKTREELSRFRQKCEENIKFIKINKEVCIVSGTLQQYINKMPTIYGALIYSYARSHMYDTILSRVDPSKLFGMDTDSAFITVGQYNELFKKYPEIFGEGFGQFKEEIIELVDSKNEDGPFGIFVAPKCYCFYGRNKKTGKERFVKARFKGINIDRDRIWDTSVDYNKLTASEIHDLYYQETLPKIDVDFYRRCLKENVTILHSNLAKTIMNVRGAGEEHEPDFINIKQHFCLKVIKHNA